MPESNSSTNGPIVSSQSQASVDAREISDPASLTRQEIVDTYWEQYHKDPETRGQSAIQVIPQDWGWKTSGMGKGVFKRLNPDALTSHTVTLGLPAGMSSAESSGFWTMDHPTDEYGNWNGYGRDGDVEMYIVFPKDYLVDREDAISLNPEFPSAIQFNRGAQFTIVGVEDVTIAEPGHSDNNDKLRRPVYQWQWTRYIMVPKGYEDRYYHDVEESTTDPAAKEELSRHRKDGTLLQSTRHVALQGLQMNEGLVWQQVNKGHTNIALPVIPQNHIDKFLYEAYTHIASSDGKTGDVNTDTMLKLLAENQTGDSVRNTMSDSNDAQIPRPPTPAKREGAPVHETAPSFRTRFESMLRESLTRPEDDVREKAVEGPLETISSESGTPPLTQQLRAFARHRPADPTRSVLLADVQLILRKGKQSAKYIVDLSQNSRGEQGLSAETTLVVAEGDHIAGDLPGMGGDAVDFLEDSVEKSALEAMVAVYDAPITHNKWASDHRTRERLIAKGYRGVPGYTGLYRKVYGADRSGSSGQEAAAPARHVIPSNPSDKFDKSLDKDYLHPASYSTVADNRAKP